jgi:hypothetical protein
MCARASEGHIWAVVRDCRYAGCCVEDYQRGLVGCVCGGGPAAAEKQMVEEENVEEVDGKDE